MKPEQIDPHAQEWHIYKNGGLIKVLPRSIFSEEEVTEIWKKRFPNDEITVK